MCCRSRWPCCLCPPSRVLPFPFPCPPLTNFRPGLSLWLGDAPPAPSSAAPHGVLSSQLIHVYICVCVIRAQYVFVCVCLSDWPHFRSPATFACHCWFGVCIGFGQLGRSVPWSAGLVLNYYSINYLHTLLLGRRGAASWDALAVVLCMIHMIHLTTDSRFAY